jgi:hypothetical protein
VATQTVLDAFTGSLDANWDNWGSGSVVSNQFVLTTSTTAFAYFGAQWTPVIDLETDKSLGSTFVNAGNQSLLGYGSYPISLVFSASSEAYWVIVSGTAFAYTNVGGSYTERGSVSHVNGRRYIVGMSGTDILWRWSDDGITWTTAGTLANPYGDTTVQGYVMVGTDQANGSTTTATFDDFSLWEFGPSEVALTAATGTWSVAAVTAAPQPVTVSLTAATATWAPVATSPAPQPVTVALTPAAGTWSARPVTAVPGPVTATLQPAAASWSAVAVTAVPQPVTVALAAAAAVYTAVPLTATPGPVTVALTAAVATWTAVPVSTGGRTTPRPSTGTTARPGSGTTARPYTGITPRP